MHILVSYDISIKNNGQKRLNKIYKICKKYGNKIQKSVFICDLKNKELNLFKKQIYNILDRELDSCFFIITKEYFHIGNKIKIHSDNII